MTVVYVLAALIVGAAVGLILGSAGRQNRTSDAQSEHADPIPWLNPRPVCIQCRLGDPCTVHDPHRHVNGHGGLL